MTLLYVLPHPDDESFGPSPAIARQIREGHDVHLLTLTKGEATKVRHGLGLSVEAMGAQREAEMRCVADVLGLGLTVLDFPDGGLADLDPRHLEQAVADAAEVVRPDVMVTYAVHGNSGHPDHLVTHAVVKRVFCAARERRQGPRRLALFTLVEGEIEETAGHLRGSPRSHLGAVVTFSETDREQAERALGCYKTYAEVIAAHQPLRQVADGVPFILFGESHEVPLDSLTDDLPRDAEEAGAKGDRCRGLRGSGPHAGGR